MKPHSDGFEGRPAHGWFATAVGVFRNVIARRLKLFVKHIA